MRGDATDLRRSLPPVDSLLAAPELEQAQALYGRVVVRHYVRSALESLRQELRRAGERTDMESAVAGLPAAVAADLDRDLGRPLRRVINATGIFLHTNLGRAPLPRSTAAELPARLDAYCDLEMELESGGRGDRNRRAGRLLVALTGAEEALVVNNNAGALVLILAALARGREVIVSRGELVEIGGSFRIPEIMAAAGVRLVEVGTTNRTRIADFARAVGPETALLLKVHRSNFRLSGFVESTDAGELVELGRERKLPVVVDEGSGLLARHRAPQLADHPSFQELIATGASLVCGSGDKLLGGPQAGIIAGAAELVRRCHRHPLYRALRPDRAAFAALEAVLRRHLAGEPLPLDRLWPEAEAHRRRLQRAAERLGAEIVEADAFLGGGAAPEAPVPGEALALAGDDDLLRRLRQGEPSVVGYLRRGRLMLDLRTVDPADDEALLAAVERETGG